MTARTDAKAEEGRFTRSVDADMRPAPPIAPAGDTSPAEVQTPQAREFAGLPGLRSAVRQPSRTPRLSEEEP